MAFLLLGGPGSLRGQGIAFGLGAEGSHLNWSDDLGLDDATVLGGYASMAFGRYVRVQLGLSRASSVETRLAETDFPAAENRVNATRAATRILLNVGSGTITPLLAASGGVLRMEPEGRSRADQLFVGWGGGIALRPLPWLETQLLLEDVRFRMDRSLLSADDGVGPDPDADKLRSHLMASLGVGFRLGDQRPSEAADQVDRAFSGVTRGSMEGLLIPVEVRGGILRFDNDFQVENQPTAAVSLGVGFGPYFGLRGSYLRGGSNGLGTLSGWSGEAIFSVGRATSFSPYLLLGYGELVFEDDFRNEAGNAVPDQNVFIAGAGIGLALSDRSRLTASLKDYMTTSGPLEDAASTSDLQHSFGLEAGLSFLLVGSRADRDAPTAVGVQQPKAPEKTQKGAAKSEKEEEAPSKPEEEVEGLEPGEEVTDTVIAAPDTVAVQEVQDTVAAQDTVVAEAAPALTDTVSAATDTVGGELAQDTAPAEAAPAPDTAAAARPDSADIGYQSDRTVILPLPAEGELYIRYGPPAAREAVAPPESVRPVPVQAGTSAAVDTVSWVSEPDTAALARIIRREIERSREEAPDTMEPAPSPATPGRADTVAPTAVDTNMAANDRIDRLTEEVRELTRLLREGLGRRQSEPGAGMVLAVPGGSGTRVTRVVTTAPSRGLLLDTRLGLASHRDGGAGITVSADLSRGAPSWWWLRPHVGLEATHSSVEPTAGPTTVSGSVTTISAGIGSFLDLPSVGPVSPSFSFALEAMGGSVDGDTPDDQEVMDDLYDAFRLGVSGGIHLAYQWPGSRNFITLGMRSHSAGARSSWSVEGGVRVRLGGSAVVQRSAAAPDRLEVEVPGRVEQTRTGETSPEAERPGEPPPGMEGVSGSDVADSTVLARLEAVENALAQEREARQAAEDSLTAVRARTTRETRSQADSLQGMVDSLRAEASAERREGEARASLRSALESLAATYPGLLEVRSTDRGLSTILGGSAFQVSSATLDARSEAAVRQVADLLRSAGQGEILVEGHTDSTGSEETNLLLSRARAEAVRAALIQQGVAADRVVAMGRGEAQLLVNDETAEGRSRNRRVEIILRDR